MIDFPSNIEPNSMELLFQSNTKVFESTFNRSATTSKFAGDRWKLVLNFKNLDWEIDALNAFMISLGGRSGRARIPMFHRPGAPAMGNPVVNGAGQTGGIIETNGWLPNKKVLSAGHYIGISDELKMVKKDVFSNQSGAATIEIAPWLRTSPADGTEIVTNRPHGIFRLEEDEVGMSMEPSNGAISLSFVEAFYS